MKKISSRKLATIINVADWGLSVAILAVGYLLSRHIANRIWPLEVAASAKWVCCICGCGLGLLGVMLAISKRDKRTKEVLVELGAILVLVTIYGVISARAGVDAPSMIAALTLQLIVGAIIMIIMIGCSEVMNRIRCKLFGNMTKIGGMWFTFYEVH